MFEKFHYKSVEEIVSECERLGVTIPFSDNTDSLTKPLSVGKIRLSNRMGIAPMEGADSTPYGSPSELTERRYVREARGGAAIIWYEAISIVEEGRSSATQLLITKKNRDDFKILNEKVKEAGIRANGREPYLVMQANHSGRYSNPGNKKTPLIAERNKWLETFRSADDSCIVSDDYLSSLEEKMGDAAKLAKEALFDAVDIKSCHGYLFQEVASAYGRPGRYGGSYENRMRLLKNSIRAAKVHESDSFSVVARIGVYDGYPSGSIGFGQNKDGSMDLEEPVRLVKELREELGIDLINITMGNPYATTHVTRPFDFGKYIPDEHQFVGMARMIGATGRIKKEVPGAAIFASAPTYLRQFADLYAAGAVTQGYADGFLFGRMAFANPDFPNEIIHSGRINADRVCLTCGKCGDLIRSHKPTGCVIRDATIFMPYYKEFIETRKDLPANFRG